MKGLKKLALATAVAAAPFAQAELTAMDDALLADMTGQAGITIDIDLDMTIDAIKYVDQDGDTTGTGAQGAITMKGLTIDNDGGAATIRGITIDADGTDGLVMGLNQIGDDSGNGIDITIDAVLINNGNANLNNYNTVQSVQGSYNTAALNTMVYSDYANGTAAGTLAAVATADAQALAAVMTDAEAVNLGFEGGAAQVQALVNEVGGTTEQQVQAKLAVAGYGAAQTAGGSTDPLHNNLAAVGADVGVLQGAGAQFQSAGAGNIGGFKIENFRNYIQDTLVNKYNGVFDMALADSTGAITDVNTSAAGRFVRGEIVIQGTGNYAQGTSGLRISGQFGGAIDEAAWIDEGQEFGIQDLGFFHGVDDNSDGISDTIEGMHFTMDINVVDHKSWDHVDNGGAAGVTGSDNVAALAISGLALEGTIMMGSLYLDSSTASVDRQSLGSVLVKDIDMTGTTVYIYGH